MKKLKSTGGETLVEVLAAILISALAVIMLTYAISATTNMARQSAQAGRELEAQLEIAELGQNSEDGAVTVAYGASTVAIEVSVSGSQGELRSYRLKGVAEGE